MMRTSSNGTSYNNKTLSRGSSLTTIVCQINNELESAQQLFEHIISLPMHPNMLQNKQLHMINELN